MAANVVDVFTCGEEKLVQPSRLQRFARSAVDSEYIWSSGADLWTAQGFTTSEQQADNRTFTGETRKRIRGARQIYSPGRIPKIHFPPTGRLANAGEF